MINNNNLKNIYFLCKKELYGLINDTTLVMLIIFIFTFVILTTKSADNSELNNVNVAVIDSDKSYLSTKIINKITPPMFKYPKEVNENDATLEMYKGNFVFVINIPNNFQNDILQGKDSKIQILIDTTAISQASSGISYLQESITKEILNYLNKNNNLSPIITDTYILFNENSMTSWQSAINQMVLNITILAILLTGAAVIREKEQGTIEHLLVMPVSVTQIAIAKILSSAIVILISTILSLIFIIHFAMQIPLQGSLLLFILCTFIYLFSATSLGMFISTLTPTLPQFGLIIVVLMLMINFISGSATPITNMNILIQKLVMFIPTTHYVLSIKNLLFKGANFSSIWINLLIMSVFGIIFLFFAILQFRKMIEKTN